MRYALKLAVSSACTVVCAGLLALVVGAGGGAEAATTVKGTLYATVGPGFTITLKRQNGTVVKTLGRGTWKVVVDDKSSAHNFHLTGSGVNKSTTVSAIVKSTWTVTFSPGTYKYVCDPHKGSMKGQFTVT